MAFFGGGGDRFVCAVGTVMAFRLAKSRSVCGLSAKLLAISLFIMFVSSINILFRWMG